MTYECGGHEYGEQGRRYRFAPFFSRIFLLRAFRVNPFHPLRQFVLFLFSAISALYPSTLKNSATTLRCDQSGSDAVAANAVSTAKLPAEP